MSRSLELEPLEPFIAEIKEPTLIVGGGIAGISAALEIANAGHQVYLVEREPSIGGHMAQFDKTFPTLDCAACILTPRMSEVGQHENTVSGLAASSPSLPRTASWRSRMMLKASMVKAPVTTGFSQYRRSRKSR